MKRTVAACQILTYADVECSVEKIGRWIRKAAQMSVDIIAFPEAATCGYACDRGYWERADPQQFERAESQIIDMAREWGIAVVLGSVHWEGEDVYNSLLIIDRDGEVRGRYAKTHLAEKWPKPGRHLPVYSLAEVPSCFIICHDVRYPELVRLPAIAGAQICYFCSNESGLLAEYKLSAYRAMPIARATENGIFVVMANAPADPDAIRSASQSHGNSKIIHPDGNVLDEAGFFEERLVIATIDLDEATRGIARRSVEDETILKEWMRSGVKWVST